jgi:hypothetical protein
MAKDVYDDLLESDLSRADKVAYREVYLNLARVHLAQKHPDHAYRCLSEYLELQGELPRDLEETHDRLVATFADFMPLDRVEYWSYSGTGLDSSFSLRMLESSGGEYRLQRREGKSQTEETWTRQGILLVRQAGKRIEKVPVNLNPAEDALPSVTYVSQGREHRSELVSFRETVDLRGRRRFPGCLKIRIRSAGSSEVETLWLAPDVGEVKREIRGGDGKVVEIILSDHALRKVAAVSK